MRTDGRRFLKAPKRTGYGRCQFASRSPVSETAAVWEVVRLCTAYCLVERRGSDLNLEAPTDA